MTERKTYQREYREKYKAQAKRVNITLSQEEHRALQKAAKKEGVKLTSYIKSLALSSFQNQTYIPSELKDELKTLRYAIYNIANNVNQLAHHSNTFKNMTISEENNLLQYLKQLDEVVQSYTEGRILSTEGEDDDH